MEPPAPVFQPLDGVCAKCLALGRPLKCATVPDAVHAAGVMPSMLTALAAGLPIAACVVLASLNRALVPICHG